MLSDKGIKYSLAYDNITKGNVPKWLSPPLKIRFVKKEL